jgi:hypothetical protein
LAGLVTVNSRVDTPPTKIGEVKKRLVKLGLTAATVNGAVAATAVPALVCKVLVVLVTVPTVLLVMG